MFNITVEYYKKNIKVTLIDGQIIEGIYSEDFEDEKEMLVGSTIIEKEQVKEIEIM